MWSNFFPKDVVPRSCTSATWAFLQSEIAVSGFKTYKNSKKIHRIIHLAMKDRFYNNHLLVVSYDYRDIAVAQSDKI